VRKRWLLWILIVITCAVALAWRFPATIYKPLGLLRHEAFFDGKPTTYWVRALKQEGFLGHPPPEGDVGKTLREGGSAAVPVLREIAASPDESLRAEALRALALIGPEAKDATAMLTETIKNEDNSSRFMLASEALAKVDPSAAAETLSAVLRDKTNEGRRSWALTELLKIAPQGKEAIPVLEEMWHNPQEEVVLRVQAIRVLWHLKQPAEPLAAALVEVISSPQNPAGVQALDALGEMGPDAKPALPALLKLLTDPTIPAVGRHWGPPHRAATIRAAGKIGPEARTALPALFAILQSDDYVLRTEVAWALTHIGRPAKEALAIREAVSGTSVALVAGRFPASLTALPLVQVTVRTWVPGELQDLYAIREALQRIDPDAAGRASGSQ
jgi:HEAT repeat protein